MGNERAAYRDFFFKAMHTYGEMTPTFVMDLVFHCRLVVDVVVDSCHGSSNSVARGREEVSCFHFLQRVIVMEFWVFARKLASLPGYP
jgi:hypothetical protein